MFTARNRMALFAVLVSITEPTFAQMPTPAPLQIEPLSPSTIPFSPSPSPMPMPSPSPMDVIPPPIPSQDYTSEEDATALYKRIVELYGAGQYDEAVPLAEQYTGLVEQTVGNKHLAYASAINVQARLYHSQGQLDLAEPLLRSALEIHERERGPDHSDVANDLDGLAQICQEQGRLDEAEPLFQRALAINEKSAATEPANVGRSLNNLAWLYQEQGRFAEAEPLMKRAIVIIGDTLGTKDADYGRALDTLAKINDGQGRLAEAAPLYQQAMVILSGSLGPGHESVAVTSENLGGLLKSQGRLEEAEPLLKRALTTKEAVFGPVHPRVANVLAQLGDLYRQQGRDKEAQSMFERALSIRKTTIREIPVFFATDRKREGKAKSIAFGGERTHTLSFGQATVMVSKPEVSHETTPRVALPPQGQVTVNASRLETTEVARLAIREVELAASSQSLMQSARQRLEGAKAFPRQVFVFVHGYNVSFENALRRTAQIAYDLNFDGASFLFSWPSRSSLWSYTSDRESAEIAVNHLKEFLVSVIVEAQATKVHLIAHSMGNVVLLGALEKIALSRDQNSRLRFSEIVLHSPDVDEDRFDQLMRELKDLGANFTLYASTSDRALGVSAWLWGVVGRVGAVPAFVPGVETIDVTEAGSSLLGLNHDLYATNPAIFNDMRLVLELGKHPPDKRSAVFEPRTTEGGVYWHYRRLKATPPP